MLNTGILQGAFLPVAFPVPSSGNGGYRAEDEVADHPERGHSLMDATLDAIDEGVLVVDNDGHVVDHNERFREMWKIPEKLASIGDGEAMLAHVQDQLADPETFLEPAEELQAEPKAISRDRIELEDGRVLDRHSRPHKVDGETVGRVWSFHPVTDQVETQRELEESNDRLEGFASVLSHDLREPLRAIAAHVELLEDEVGDAVDEDVRERLGVVRASAKQAQGMVEGLHRLSSLGQDDLDISVVDLDEVVEEVLAELKGRIDEAAATFEVGSLPTVEADRAQLILLFQNLIENALAHGGEGRLTVTLRTRPLLDGRQEIVVQDDGQGISEDDQEEIFGMFQRGPNGHHDGQGIGLALCRRVVDRHGGEIEIESSAGEGASFWFSLPSSNGHATVDLAEAA